jgi:hypothetical protein
VQELEREIRQLKERLALYEEQEPSLDSMDSILNELSETIPDFQNLESSQSQEESNVTLRAEQIDEVEAQPIDSKRVGEDPVESCKEVDSSDHVESGEQFLDDFEAPITVNLIDLVQDAGIQTQDLGSQKSIGNSPGLLILF